VIVSRLLCKQEVAGSIPAGSTSQNPRKSIVFHVVVDRTSERIFGSKGAWRGHQVDMADGYDTIRLSEH